MRKEYIQVFTATEKKEDAEKIAKALVEKRLAGCVQIVEPFPYFMGRFSNGDLWVKNSLSISKVEETIHKIPVF